MLKLLPDVFPRVFRWRETSRGTAAILPLPVRLFIPVFLICLGLNAIGLYAAAQFTSGVNLVEVYATVIDRRGDPVRGLTAGDFIVEEDGRRQTIEAFAAGEVPLSLAIAVDHSFSVTPGRLRDEIYAVQRLLGELRDEDRVLLLGIGSQVEVLSPLSNDHRAAYDAVRGLEPWGTTPLYDATLDAIDKVQQATGRRALILISDGIDRYSSVSAEAMVQRARRRDVLVYPVVLQRTVPAIFDQLADVTGGRAIAVRDSGALGLLLSGIATELRAQYLLGYTPPPGGGASWRSIAVRVTRPELRVRARDGYDAAR